MRAKVSSKIHGGSYKEGPEAVRPLSGAGKGNQHE